MPAFPPSASTSALAPSRPSRPRARSATAAPRSANSLAVARPMPPEAPVTTTTRGASGTLLIAYLQDGRWCGRVRSRQGVQARTPGRDGPARSLVVQPAAVDVFLDLVLGASRRRVRELVLAPLGRVLQLRAQGSAL